MATIRQELMKWTETHNRRNVCLLTPHPSLFGCLASLHWDGANTPDDSVLLFHWTGCFLFTCPSFSHTHKHSHTHFPQPYLLCTLTVRSSASVFLCTCPDFRKFTEQQTGAKKMMIVFVCKSLASARVCVYARACVHVHSFCFSRRPCAGTNRPIGLFFALVASHRLKTDWSLWKLSKHIWLQI